MTADPIVLGDERRGVLASYDATPFNRFRAAASELFALRQYLEERTVALLQANDQFSETLVYRRLACGDEPACDGG